MEMGDPLALEYIHRSKQQDIEPLVLKAKRLGATFIHFVTADELNYHGDYFLESIIQNCNSFKSLYNKQLFVEVYFSISGR